MSNVKLILVRNRSSVRQMVGRYAIEPDAFGELPEYLRDAVEHSPDLEFAENGVSAVRFTDHVPFGARYFGTKR